VSRRCDLSRLVVDPDLTSSRIDHTDRHSHCGAIAVENGWTRDVLALHVETGYRNRAVKAINNFAVTLPPETKPTTTSLPPDPHLLAAEHRGTPSSRQHQTTRFRRKRGDQTAPSVELGMSSTPHVTCLVNQQRTGS
jgi:hypothetical protein